MNCVTIVRTLQKLKASVSVLVGDKTDLLEKAQSLYVDSCSVFSDPQDEVNYYKSKSAFFKFLDHDIHSVDLDQNLSRLTRNSMIEEEIEEVEMKLV
jgi:hypothetical protein